MSDLFPVSGRCGAVFFLEYLIEISFVAVADRFCDLIYAFIGRNQHMRRTLEADLLYIGRVSKPGLALDEPVKVVFLEVKFPD